MAISKIGSKALVDCSVASADLEDGSITNAKLANSSITVNGTSVSLGASASLKDISWQSVITASGGSNTAVAGEGYFIDTTSNTHTVTLPASPSIGDKIAIKDYAGTFGTNNLTIGRNGNNIQGVANDSLISTNRASLILVYSDATRGWLYTVESNVNALVPQYVTATGGTITTSGNFKIHTFTGDGCFVVSCGGNPSGSTAVDYLVVAGGGGAGGDEGGGGGGAGGFRESHSTPVSGCYTASPLATPTGITVSATTYPVTVGAGGARGTANPDTKGGSGSNSVFSTITSAGGGGGGYGNGPVCSEGPGLYGIPGGSGGGSGGRIGSGCSAASKGTGNTPPVSPPQGQPGGAAKTCTSSSNDSGGGGGGALVAGSNASNPSGPSGAGGNGAATLINPATGESSGCTQYYAGGGGGGCNTCNNGSSVGGLGGGAPGRGSSGIGVSADANTGGGGGGASAAWCGGAGGKGIVIIRYKYQ
jgi:hypothetical protein